MKYKILIISIFSISAFSSCEEVIDIELNDSQPQIVIEGTITPDETATVKISLTSNYFDDSESRVISDAVVTLSNGTDYEELTSNGNGLYTGNYITGKINTAYTLSIKYADNEYIAESYLNPPVSIDSIFASDALAAPPGTKLGKIVNIVFQDNPNTENYYRMVYYRNNGLVTERTGIFPVDDKLTNGNKMTAFARRVNFYLEETVRVELQAIDKDVHFYFVTLADVLANGLMESSAPYNPESNFNNNALGYFSAYSSTSAEITVE